MWALVWERSYYCCAWSCRPVEQQVEGSGGKEEDQDSAYGRYNYPAISLPDAPFTYLLIIWNIVWSTLTPVVVVVHKHSPVIIQLDGNT